MEIKLNKRLTLSERQQEYIKTKIDTLKRVARRGDDESSKAYIDIEFVQHKDPSETICIKVKFVTPGKTYHSEECGTTVEEVIDIIEQKLRNQIEHQKR
jgi:ribosome-associated translation inhibitor RaiA